MFSYKLQRKNTLQVIAPVFLKCECRHAQFSYLIIYQNAVNKTDEKWTVALRFGFLGSSGSNA